MSTRFRYDSHKDDDQFVDLNHQHRADEKTRCQTLKFEAHFLKVATANRWPAFSYRGGTYEELPARSSRR